MNKKLVLLLAIAAGLAGAPWLTGQIIEKRYHSMMQQIAQESGLEITLGDYRRGWLTAEAESRIEFPSQQGGMTSMVIHHHIRHGLLLFDQGMPRFELGRITHEIALPSETGERWQTMFGTSKPLQISTDIGLNGSQHWHVTSSTLNRNEEGKELQIHPLSLTMTVSAKQNEVKGALHWDGLQLSSARGNGEIAPLEWHFDMQRIRPFVWTGDSSWQQGTIRLKQGNGRIVLSGLSLDSHTTSDNRERLSSEQQLRMSGFTVDDKQYGPGSLALAIRHIPHSTIENIGHIQQQATALSANGNPEMAKYALQQLGMQLLGELPALIAADPVIEISEIALQTPEGTVKGHFSFSISGANANEALNLPALKQKSHMQLELAMPAALFNAQGWQQLEPLIRQGLIRNNGSQLVIQASLEQGNLVVNERPVPLPF